MNGFTLLMTLASLGVDFSYGTTTDKQREYTIQIEPEVVPLLSSGQHIDSDVPVEAGQIQRLCIRVGMTPITHTAVSEQAFRQLLVSAARTASRDPALSSGETQVSIVWPATGNPQQAFGVSHGYQPDQQNQQEYYVQIDPTTFRTLAPGDEIHATIDPAAGRVARFVVSAGNQQLPKVAARPTQSAGTPLPQSVAPLAGTKERSRFQNIGDAPLAPISSPAAAGDGARSGEYTPFAGTDARQGATAWNSPATDYPRQQSQPGSNYGGYGGNDPLANRGTQGLYPLPPETAPSDPRAGYGAPPTGHAGNFNPSYGAAPLANEPPIATGYPPPVAGQQQQYPQSANRYDAQVADNRYANARTATAPLTPQSNAPLATTNFAPTAAPLPAAQDKPWTPFLLSMVALFFSIGGNLYLAWTALEFHSRYRNAIERLRSAARSS